MRFVQASDFARVCEIRNAMLVTDRLVALIGDKGTGRSPILSVV
jgi:hypothetical protein